jgi:hypothetical protein
LILHLPGHRSSMRSGHAGQRPGLGLQCPVRALVKAMPRWSLLAMWRWFKGVSGYPRGGWPGDCVSDQPVPANTKRQPPSIVGQYCVVALIVIVMIGLVLWADTSDAIHPAGCSDSSHCQQRANRGKQIRVVVLICLDT